MSLSTARSVVSTVSRRASFRPSMVMAAGRRHFHRRAAVLSAVSIPSVARAAAAKIAPPPPTLSSSTQPPSSDLKARVLRQSLYSKVCSAEEAANKAGLFQDGAIIGLSGFTGVGYPKLVPMALARSIRDRAASSGVPPPRMTVLTGASTGRDIEDALADVGAMAFRTPYQAAPSVVKNVNRGEIMFSDLHLSKLTDALVLGWFSREQDEDTMKLRYGDPAVTGRPLPKPRTDGRFDVAIVEATGIEADGSLILGKSVGATPELIALADNIIVELNTSLPNMRGWHDFPTIPLNNSAIFSSINPIINVSQRTGMSSVQIDPERIVAIVESKVPDEVPSSPIDDASKAIAKHLMNFFEYEVGRGRLPATLLPLQSGIGNIANAVMAGLAQYKHDGLEVWTEVLQDSIIPLIESGKVVRASTCSLKLSEEYDAVMMKNEQHFRDRIVLRPQRLSNMPELIHRLGVIAMNTPLEVDMYGHVNSTCAAGSKMVHGLGGSGDFLRHARLSIMHTPSTRPGGKGKSATANAISCIVPMASHIDHTEHDLDVLVTDQGLADLRGLAPRERARRIIANCVHPEYKPILNDYLSRAEAACLNTNSMHEPQMLEHAFAMHIALTKTGSMKNVKF